MQATITTRRWLAAFPVKFRAFLAIVFFKNHFDVIRIVRSATNPGMNMVKLVIGLSKAFVAIRRVCIELLNELRPCQAFAACGDVAAALSCAKEQEKNHDDEDNQEGVVIHWALAPSK